VKTNYPTLFTSAALLLMTLACSLQPSTVRNQIVNKETPYSTLAPKVSICTVTASHLNVRTDPGTYAAVKDVLEQGQEVQWRKFQGGWYQIDYVKDGRLVWGWVNARYINCQ
jgi:uncharacterized protein YgiM (DUF1202 family)